jgi:hypothetical protein
VLIEDPSKNLVASFNFTSVMLDEGMTFIFGSLICVANGLGGFNSHLANSKEPEASSSTSSNDLDDFMDNLNCMLLPDLAQQIQKMSVEVMHQIYSGRIQTDLKRPHDLNPSSTWRRIWICCSRSRTRAPPLAGLSGFIWLPTEGYTQGGRFWVRMRRDQELEGVDNTRFRQVQAANMRNALRPV